MTIFYTIFFILIVTSIYLIIKNNKMAQEVTDLKAAADKAVQTITELKATNATQAAQIATDATTIADLQSQIANAIVPADITPITDELNAATA